MMRTIPTSNTHNVVVRRKVVVLALERVAPHQASSRAASPYKGARDALGWTSRDDKFLMKKKNHVKVYNLSTLPTFHTITVGGFFGMVQLLLPRWVRAGKH